MSFLQISIFGSLFALLLMTIGFVWLFMAGKMEHQEISPEKQFNMGTQGMFQARNGVAGKRWFKGKLMAASWGGSISTREIIDLLKAGKFREAGPWAISAIGALLAFLFWPLFVGEITSMPRWLTIGFTALFLVTAVRAAWPRAARKN